VAVDGAQTVATGKKVETPHSVQSVPTVEAVAVDVLQRKESVVLAVADTFEQAEEATYLRIPPA
jgi:hypothetical protein